MKHVKDQRQIGQQELSLSKPETGFQDPPVSPLLADWLSPLDSRLRPSSGRFTRPR